MRGPGLLVLVAIALLGRTAFAQQPAGTGGAVTLVASGTLEPASLRLAKLTSTELSRRGQTLVTESDGAALLGRPLAAAVVDCSGDDLCFVALGQVVHATQVLVVSAAISPKDSLKYDCLFRVMDMRSGKTRGPMVVTVISSESGLLTAANTIAEIVAPRPRIAAVATPTPVIPAPTPTLVAPLSTSDAVAVDPITATAPLGTPGLDAPPPVIAAKRRRQPLTRDPAFWAVAGAGVLALGAGAFLGAASLQEDEPDKRGTSTVQVQF